MSFARQVGNCLAIVCVFKSREPWAWRCPKSSKVCFPGGLHGKLHEETTILRFRGVNVQCFFCSISSDSIWESDPSWRFFGKHGVETNNEIVYWSSWTDEKKMCETWLAMKILSLEMFFVVPLTLVWPVFGLKLACCCIRSKIMQTNYQFDVGSEYSTLLCYVFEYQNSEASTVN